MDLSTLHTNQRLLVELLIQKGATVTSLDPFEELLEVSYNGKIDFLMDRFSSQVPYHVVKMSADKHFAKKILSDHGISTPEGKVFTDFTVSQALQYAQNLYPVVLKPNWGSHGDFVQVDLRNETDLEAAIDLFINSNREHEPYILEKYYPWKEYRLFITSKGDFAVVHRQCASIIGNGYDNIEKIIEHDNNLRINLKKEQPTSICPIVIDNEVHKHLHGLGMDLNSIPEKNKQIFLRNESNLAKGGKAIDQTYAVHESIKLLAAKALACFPGLPVAGLDLLCEDITQPLNDQNYTIIEINSNPGLAMHTYPSEGQSQNVVQYLLNVMFPYIKSK